MNARTPTFRSQVAAEIVKLTTTRTARWLLLGAVALCALAVSGVVASGGVPLADLPTESGIRTVLAHGGLAAILPLVLGILISAGEYRQGIAVDTFLTEPRRGRVLGAKLLTGAGVGLVAGVLDAAVTVGAMAAWYAGKNVDLDLTSTVVTHSVIGIVVWTAVYGALGVAIGALLPNPPAAIVSVVVWLFIAETAFAGLLVDLGRWLPGTAASALGNSALDGLLSQVGGGAVLVAWTALAAAGALVATRRRDVT